MSSPARYSLSVDWPTSRKYCRLNASFQANYPANHHTLRISPYDRASAPDYAKSLNLSMVQGTRLRFATETRLLQPEDSMLSIHSFVVCIANVPGSNIGQPLSRLFFESVCPISLIGSSHLLKVSFHELDRRPVLDCSLLVATCHVNCGYASTLVYGPQLISPQS